MSTVRVDMENLFGRDGLTAYELYCWFGIRLPQTTNKLSLL